MHFAPADAPALPLWLARPGDWPDLPAAARAWAEATGFTGKPGEFCLIPDGDALAGALMGLGPDTGRERFPLGRAPAALPARPWRIAGAPAGLDPRTAALGWLLGQYRFTRYKPSDAPQASLVAPDGADAATLEALARSEALTRDLVNTPAADMGPAELEAAAHAVADAAGGTCTVTAGDALADGFPLIAAVGRASPRAPRLIDLRFRGEGPAVTLVGKGICFDTGGLDIKPSAGMLLMKKDMGGAATALGLAQLLAETGRSARMRLRVLIPAADNAISGDAFRPGDILRSRKGPTVEVNNTDAEGRLVLADALALAAEEAPDWLISLATLTGAARVALGPDLPPLYCDDDAAAAAICAAGAAWADPLWRMPFWTPYEAMIEPGIADLDNAPSGGFAGSITAALFLRRFTEGAGRYAHLDLYAWQPTAAPGRSKGGLQQGARALWAALPGLLA